MNRRLVAVSLIGIALAFGVGYLGNQVVEVQRFYSANAGDGIWLLKSAVSVVSSAATLLYVLLVAGIAGVGKEPTVLLEIDSDYSD